MTLEAIMAKVRKEAGMEEEQWVSDEELVQYINDGIDEAEAEIHTIYEDYFLASETLPLVAGTQSYDLPEDIYANKIRKIVYSSGQKSYVIARIQNIVDAYDNTVGNFYRYYITNTADDGRQINFVPVPNESNPTAVKIWYLRQAAVLEDADDECDIPEFSIFVVNYAKVKCIEKDLGNPMLEKCVMNLEASRQKMIETLKLMVPDDDNFMLGDLSFYSDFDMDERGYYRTK